MPRPRNDGAPTRPVTKLRLTDPYLRALKPAAERTLHWDTRVPGLALAVEPSGHKSWRFTFRAGGRGRVYTIGRFEAFSLATARDRAKVLLGQVAEGKDPQAEKQRGRRAETFEDVAARYLEHAQRVNRSWRQPAALVAKHLAPRWNKLRARDISRGDVRTVIRAISQGGAPVVANAVLAAASAIFSWGLKEEVGDLLINPCVGIDRNEVRSRTRVLTENEILTFWRAFDDAGLICGTALKVLLLCGQRPGEVASLRWDQISDLGWWALAGLPNPATQWRGTKNGQDHRCWLTAEVRHLIAELADGTGFVFPGDQRGTKPLDEKRLATAMRKICATLGVKDKVTPHDLRRTHGTLITRLGFGKDAMNRLENHREGGIASVYDQHDYADEMKKVQQAVSARIRELVDGPEGGPITVTVGEADVIPLRLRRRA